MKALDFQYQKPASVDEALAILSKGAGSVEPLAGGQSLMPMMNFRLAAPEILLDLNALKDLAGITVSDGWITIGAMTRYHQLETSDQLAGAAPLMARALPHIAHPAIRNRGTLGGSVALADPAAEMPAILLALGGEIVLKSADGDRTVSADDFFVGVYETDRAENELVTAIRVPVAATDQRHGFYEIVRRHGDYAMAGCAVSAAADLADVKIVLFGVADRPIRARDAENALTSKADAVDAAIATLGDVPFQPDMTTSAETKRHLAGVALRRAWAEVMA